MLEYILIMVYALVSFGIGAVSLSGIEKRPDLNNALGKFLAFIMMSIIWPFFAGARLGTKLDLD
jgi:hypothetical protein